MYFCTGMRNIEAKMAAFTDAGLYEQDSHIDFEPEDHVYLRYIVARILRMDSIISQIVTICRERDLGHKLL